MRSRRVSAGISTSPRDRMTTLRLCMRTLPSVSSVQRMVSTWRNDMHCRSARRHSGSQKGRQFAGGQRNSTRDPATGTCVTYSPGGYREGHARRVEG